jgi:hypothetical protein
VKEYDDFWDRKVQCWGGGALSHKSSAGLTRQYVYVCVACHTFALPSTCLGVMWEQYAPHAWRALNLLVLCFHDD